jgi:galactokinase
MYVITKNRYNQEQNHNINSNIFNHYDIMLKEFQKCVTVNRGILTMQLIKQRIIGHAPGRICLLGDNVDLIERPVLAVAISTFLSISLQIRNDDRIILVADDIDFQKEFKLGEELSLVSPLKYLEAVYQRSQSHIATGFEATIQSQIPVSAGMSSSTALCIAFIRALSQTFDTPHDTVEIAKLFYMVERENLNIECGRMDRYAIAYGRVTYIETGPTPSVEAIPIDSLPIVVADTQEPHDTQQLQEWLRDCLRARDKVLVDSLLRFVKLVEQGKAALLRGDLETLRALMSRQKLKRISWRHPQSALTPFAKQQWKQVLGGRNKWLQVAASVRLYSVLPERKILFGLHWQLWVPGPEPLRFTTIKVRMRFNLSRFL